MDVGFFKIDLITLKSMIRKGVECDSEIVFRWPENHKLWLGDSEIYPIPYSILTGLELESNFWDQKSPL